MINSLFVGEEIFIDGEGTLNRSVGHDFSHDGLLIVGEGVGIDSSDLIGGVFMCVFLVALFNTLGSGLTLSAGL